MLEANLQFVEHAVNGQMKESVQTAHRLTHTHTLIQPVPQSLLGFNLGLKQAD